MMLRSSCWERCKFGRIVMVVGKIIRYPSSGYTALLQLPIRIVSFLFISLDVLMYVLSSVQFL